MKFQIKYSEKIDVQIYISALYIQSYLNYGQNRIENAKKYFTPEFVDQVSTAPDEQSARMVIFNYWKQIRQPTFKVYNKIIIKWYTKLLNEEQDLIIKPLEKVYKRKFPFKKITIYLTSYSSSPYNYQQRWFAMNRNNNTWGFITVSIHELNHFMFYYYFYEKLKKLGLNTNQS